MTRIAVLSDLHLEFGPFARPEVKADVTVLAGDTYTKHRAFDRDDARAFFGCPVLAVLGNHEFYSGKIDTAVEKTRVAAAEKGILLLERQEVVVAGVRFLGCTLWSDFRLFARDDLVRVRADANLCVGDRHSGGLNDFRSIRVAADGYRRFRPLDAAKLFQMSVAWLDERLSEPFDGATVVVTHHAPSIRCVPQKHLADRRTAAYASHLDWLIEKHQPDAWISGHIHSSHMFRIGRTLLVSNPRGYVPDHVNPDFRPDLVIEVPVVPD
jgi:Icc-related predicted phosphoesterase